MVQSPKRVSRSTTFVMFSSRDARRPFLRLPPLDPEARVQRRMVFGGSYALLLGRNGHFPYYDFHTTHEASIQLLICFQTTHEACYWEFEGDNRCLKPKDSGPGR